MQNLHITKLTRLGNSLAIIIPAPILRAQNFQRGDSFVFGVYEDNVLIIKKLSTKDLLELKPPIIQHD